jgi:PmbA protein
MTPHRESLHQTTAVARDLLSHASSGRWEVFAKVSCSREVELVRGSPKQVIHSQEMGVGVRTSGAGRSGFAAASGLEAAAARSAVEGALANQVNVSFDPLPPPHLLGAATPPPPRQLAPADWENQVSAEIANALQALDRSLRPLRTIYQEGQFAWLLTTCDGFVVTFEECRGSLLVEVTGGGEATGVWREWLHIRDPEALDPRTAAEQIGNRILLTRSPVTIDTGLKDVILHGEVTAHLLAALVPLFCATPEMSDRLPEMLNSDGELTSPALTLIDHRADASAPVHGPCDGEGLPSRRTVLLDAGVPRHRLASYRDALLCGEPPRGGALRLSYRDYPSTGIAGLQVLAKEGIAPGRLLTETDRALYLLRPLAPLSIDPEADCCRLVASGVWLDNGRVRGWHPVAELRSGIGQLLRRIDAVGTDLGWYQTDQGFIRAPSLLLRHQSVVG